MIGSKSESDNGLTQQRRAHIALAASVLLFSIGWPFTKAILARIDPFSFLALEVTAAAIVAIAVAFARNAARLTWRETLIFVSLGALSPGINYALAIGGLRYTSASAAALIAAVEPTATVLLAVAILREQLNLRGAAMVVLSCIGLILIADPQDERMMVTLGSAAIVAGVLAAALYVVLLRLAPDIDPLSAVAAQLTGGALMLIAIAGILNGSRTLEAIHSLPLAYLIVIIIAGPLLDYLPYLLLTHASRYLSAATTGIAFNLSPVWAVTVSAVFLSERPRLLQIAGGVLVIATTVAYQRLFPSGSVAKCFESIDQRRRADVAHR